MPHVGGLLVRCLCTRRHNASPAAIGIRAGASCAITQGKNIGVACGLKRVMDHQLVDPVGFQPAKVFQEIRRFHACGPHHQFGLDLAAIGQANARGHDLHHFGAGEYLNAQAREKLFSRLGHAWHQGRQNAVGRLNQADLDVFVHINAVQAKSHHLTRGAMQLSGQFHTLPAPAPKVDIQRSTAPAASDTDTTGLKIVVKTLKITGSQTFAEAQLIAVTGFKSGSALTLTELRGMANLVSRYYQDNGYVVAQVYLPPQDINDGAVTITVNEGRYWNHWNHWRCRS
jgi:hypothetical protein